MPVKLGGGVSYYGIGFEARKEMNLADANLSGNVNFESDFTPFLKLDVNSQKRDYIKVGIPEFKEALGFGFLVGVYFQKPALSEFEKALKDTKPCKPCKDSPSIQ